MTELYRVRTALTGFPGGPGVATMYFLDVATAVASVDTFWADVHDRYPEVMSAHVENAGDIIEDTTGDLTGAWSATAVGSHAGGGTGPYAAPAGACITWNTGTIANHRRLRGRTFIVPMNSDRFEDDGSLDPATITILQNAANALITSQSESFVIYHRKNGGVGSNGLVTSATVHDKVAVLRSRRD